MDTDGESYRWKNKNIKNNKGKVIDNFIIPFQFFSSIWVRCPFSNDNEMDRFLLDYGRNFLPYFGSVFYIIYFITTIS